jgi:DNA-binding transcriptional MocR family regulator
MSPASRPAGAAPPPRYEQIAADLVQNILNGQIAAGEKLPPQRVLAKRLGVTTGTVSRAYEALVQRGLASARIGDGTYVRNMNPALRDQASRDAPPPVDLAYNVAVPTDEVDALARVLGELQHDPACLRQLISYQPEAGALRHRMAGAQWLQRFGAAGDWNRVMVTHGAQHALAGVLRAVARPGDTLLTEALTYPGLLALARSMRLQVIGVEMDEEGLHPEALERAAENFHARLLFCSPTLNNPTTRTMSATRRDAIAAVIRRHGLLLMEDLVHASVLEHPPTALATRVPEQSFMMASMSKVMAPGLRVGFLEASPEWLDKVAASIRTDCWMVAPLMPEIATRWIESGEADRLIARQRQEIHQRLQLARVRLQGLEYSASAWHPHVWLPLHGPWSGTGLGSALRQAGVLVRTAEQFAAGRSRVPQAVRISLNSARSLEELDRGLQTVVQTLAGAPIPTDIAP